MITIEQKKQLQIDAGIPHLPTDLTYECRIAIAGDGERGWEWQDKPHRLVYDLSRQVEADADRIEELEECNKELAQFVFDAGGQAADTLDKLTKAVEERDEWKNEAAMWLEAYTSVANKTRAVLAELEVEPLGAEFEAVWDANKGELYEP